MNRNIQLLSTLVVSIFLDVSVQAMQKRQETTIQDIFASPATKQEFYRELIQQAITENNTTKIQNLLERALQDGFDINSGDRERRTLLHNAALTSNNAAVKILLEAGADPNSKSDMNSIPLHHAVIASAEPKVIQALIAAGADATVANSYGIKPLLQAIYNNSIPVVRLLLAAPHVDLCKEEVNEYVSNHNLRQKPKYQAVIRLLDAYYTTLVDLSTDEIVKNIGSYQDKLHVLPQELQEKINHRLAHQ